MTKLREHMIQDLLQAGRSERTRECYVNAIRDYARHFNRCPSQLGLDEVRTWVQHSRNSVLKPDRIRQHLAAQKFLYAKNGQSSKRGSKKATATSRTATWSTPRNSSRSSSLRASGNGREDPATR